MKARYILIPLLASLKVMANPLMGSDGFTYGALHSKVAPQPAPPPPQAAPDPPPAPTPLPISTDGVLPDGTVINYTPDSCWTPPFSRPPVNAKYDRGTCSVCVLQRNGTDGSSDYQLWARDNSNNAMGNMNAFGIWPIDAILDGGTTSENEPVVDMGGSPLQLHAMTSPENPSSTQVFLVWATPPRDPNNSTTWLDPTTPKAMFDPGLGLNTGNDCSLANIATSSPVLYLTCSFKC